MARIFITGSADGLGQLAAMDLIEQGHKVVLHARNVERGKQALEKTPGAEDVLIADFSSIIETRELASKANAYGTFDVVIHNAGLYQVAKNDTGTEGFPLLFTVNTLAPYILTCLMYKPKRLIYLCSGMHLQGDGRLRNLPHGRITYSDTKLHDLLLCMAVARKWTDVKSNAVNPGWVPTKMGGAGAPDNLYAGYQTQVWLAVIDNPEASVSGKYFYHMRPASFLEAAADQNVQEKFLAICEQVTGIRLV